MFMIMIRTVRKAVMTFLVLGNVVTFDVSMLHLLWKVDLFLRSFLKCLYVPTRNVIMILRVTIQKYAKDSLFANCVTKWVDTEGTRNGLN